MDAINNGRRLHRTSSPDCDIMKGRGKGRAAKVVYCWIMRGICSRATSLSRMPPRDQGLERRCAGQARRQHRACRRQARAQWRRRRRHPYRSRPCAGSTSQMGRRATPPRARPCQDGREIVRRTWRADTLLRSQRALAKAATNVGSQDISRTSENDRLLSVG
jgi:hypothetical protein